MISAVSAAPASDDVVSEGADDAIVAESILDDASNAQNGYKTDEISENGGAANALAAGDEAINTTIMATNLSYSRPNIIDGGAIYPILLTSDSFPYILNNKTVTVEFNNDIKILTTVYGYANYTIPENTPVGNYPINIKFAGDDTYSGSQLTAYIDIHDVGTQIIAEENVSYSHPSVLDGSAHYPIALMTNTTIPGILANRTVSVTFKGVSKEYTTNAWGIIDYVIPEIVAAGIGTMEIEYAGEDGYIGSTFSTDIEIYDVATQIIAPKNVSYSYKDVLNGEAIYSIYLATNTTIPLPISNKTVSVEVKGVGDDYVTNAFGIINFVISNATNPGEGKIEVEYKGGDGYLGSTFTTNVNIYETQTQIIAFEDMSYSLPEVVEGLAYYPFILATNSTIPLPLANRTIYVEFGNGLWNLTTNALGIANFVIPTDADEGTYPIEITYAGEDGYDPCTFRGYVEIYEVDTQITALGNTSYSTPVVLSGLGYYPFILTTNNTIPLPLSNKTVFVKFGNGIFNYTTDILGLATFVIPNDTVAGTYPIEIVFVGDESFEGTSFHADIEIYDIETQIIALENTSYPTPIVAAELAYYPFILATNSTIPLPLANRTIYVEFGNGLWNLTTNALGIATFVIPNDTVAGNYRVHVSYAGDDGYDSTDFIGYVEVYDVESQIIAFKNASYATPEVISGLAYYPFILVTNSTVPLPLNNRTVSVKFNGVEYNVTTSALGIVNFVIPNDTSKGIYPIEITYAGEEGVDGFSFVGEIEIHDVESQIIALENASYITSEVISGLAYYPFILATNSTIPLPLNNRTVSVKFNGVEYNVTTGALGVGNFVIPNDTAKGSYPIYIVYPGEDGIEGFGFVGNVEIHDLEAQIIGLKNASYTTPEVVDGLAYYPFVLATNSTIPLPLSNRTVSVKFDGVEYNVTTGALGIANFVIPNDTAKGSYPIEITYAGEDGIEGTVFNANIKITDVLTQIIALENVSYVVPVVAEGFAYYPFVLATNSTIPLPLYNKTVYVGFNGTVWNFTTDAIGAVNFVIPNDTAKGNYTIHILYMGEDGIEGTYFNTTVSVVEVGSKITALGNMSYSLPLVYEGLAYYPIVLIATDVIPVPLANRTVSISFNGVKQNYTTNALGLINYVIPVQPAGNYTIDIVYAGDDFAGSSYTANIELYDVETKISAIKNASYSRLVVSHGDAIYPIFLATNTTIPIPIANKTVFIEFNGVSGYYTTDSLGLINFIIPNNTIAGEYPIKIAFEGYDGYVASNATGMVEVYDIQTQIIAAENVSYPLPVVKDGDAIYPILLATNQTIPIPLANRTVYVEFEGAEFELTTNALGMVNFVIPQFMPEGNYTMKIIFAGTDGLIDSSLVANVEVLSVASHIIAAENVSYSTYELVNHLAIYPILLVGEGVIPIPLADKLVIVEFNGVGGEFTTDSLGMIYYNFFDSPAGNYTLKIFYDGTEDGFIDSVFTTNVEIYDSESQIIAFDNLTYSYRDVVDGDAIYPIYLATNTTIPLPLANREVYVEFNGVGDVYTTNALGLILYTIPDTVPGSYKMLIAFDGDHEFTASAKETTVNIVKAVPKASVNVAVAVDTEPGIVTVIVTSDVDGECLITVGDEMIPVEVVDGLAYATFDDIPAGTQTAEVKFPATGKYDELVIEEEFTINPSTEKTKSIMAITGISGNNLTGVLMDENGDPIEGAEIEYTAEGLNKTVVTDEDGVFVVEAAVGVPTTISYAGDEDTAPINITIEVDAPVPVIVRVATHFNITNNIITLNGYAVDTKAGEQGMTYATELLDSDGKPISGVKISFALNDKIYNRTTNEKGSFTPYHLDMVRAGRYTMAFYFGGNDFYNATLASVCVDLDKKPIKIKASNKSYKTSTKTKSYTISVSTIVGSSLDGKAHLRSGLVFKLTINGKTFTGKTDSNGKVTFKITNLSKKGVYNAEIFFKGDGTYESATKSVKITAN